MPPGQLVAGEPAEHIPRPGIDRDVPAPGDEGSALAGQMAALHQQGDGAAAGLQGQGDHFPALGDENAPLRLLPPAQLAGGEPGEQAPAPGPGNR